MKVETTTTETLQVISFTLINESNKKKENYGVPIEQVREIRPFENVTKVPKAKPFVKGVMNLRGMIIPVIDVKKRLGFGEIKEFDKSYRILVADVRDSIYGLIVDRVDQVLQIPVNNIDPIPPDTFNSQHYVRGIAKINKNLIVLLDIISLLEETQETEEQFTEQKSDGPYSTEEESDPIETEKLIAESKKDADEFEQDDDIPEALKEVFKEDENENPQNTNPN